MTYVLDDFGSDLNAILKSEGMAGLSKIAGNLAALLRNPDFVSAVFSEDTPKGKRTLLHDAETDAYVYAHVHLPGGRGKPHSHGASWAIYGNARGHTVMTEWKRVNPESEGHSVLEPGNPYRLGTGEAKAYGPHVIHSTEHPEKAWVVRITGGDLRNVPRYRFDPEKDQLIEA
jgi:predicted metal-dependent enzyme (double-stranded beta helix superfamily)